jgi:hypothetical protein
MIHGKTLIAAFVCATGLFMLGDKPASAQSDKPLERRAPSASMSQDYCKAFPSGRRFLFLIDQTAAYTKEDTERLKRGAKEVLKMLDVPGDRLIIHTISDYIPTSNELFHECNPGCPEKGCRNSTILADQKKFVSRFYTLIDKEIPQLASTKKDESAITETIYATINQYSPAKLIIFSDMLENHRADGSLPAISFYSSKKEEMGKYLASLKGKANIFPKLSPNLDVIAFGWSKELGTTVPGANGKQPPGTSPSSINSNHKQWKIIREFWIKYFGGENRKI